MSQATANHVVHFLGLSDVTRVIDGEASFPLGILYPYTIDLQRVCAAYEAMTHDAPERSGGAPPAQYTDELTPARAAFLTSIAALHSRIAFAPGSAGASVAAAYRQVRDSSRPAA